MAQVVDDLHHLNAFRAGFRHGEDRGPTSANEADTILNSLGLPTDSKSVTCFCNGADDGAKNDQFRYLLSYAITISSGWPNQSIQKD